MLDGGHSAIIIFFLFLNLAFCFSLDKRGKLPSLSSLIHLHFSGGGEAMANKLFSLILSFVSQQASRQYKMKCQKFKLQMELAC